ncbi:MAG: cupin domain-containing protein, partial [Gammaproteobacteria bacterium]|nr:cupin domain-containing protein [Gammaproteobacteria bacterium]
MDDAVKRIVERLDLVPHPEGGYYREVYRSPMTYEHPRVPAGQPKKRSAGTLIYFLLSGSEFSALHRVKWSDELWHLYAGGPLEIFVIGDDGTLEKRVLTTDLSAGEPTTCIPAGAWQAARVAAGASYALGGCTVAPGFDYDDFEMPEADHL